MRSLDRSDINKFPFLKLTELCGRKSQLIYLPSGKIAPGLTFYYVLRGVLEKSDDIKQFIIIQKAIDLTVFAASTGSGPKLMDSVSAIASDMIDALLSDSSDNFNIPLNQQ